MNPDQRVFIITGASSGIGAASARLAHQRGAHVVMVARREDRLRELAASLPGSVQVVADVMQDVDRRRIIAETVQNFGRLDVLVNNAGRGLHVPLEQVDIDAFREVLELNVLAPLALMQLAVPMMRAQGGGAIVNVSSTMARMVVTGVGAYASTKAALSLLSATAREELAVDSIIVSTLLPTTTNTDFHTVLRQATPRPNRAALYAAGHPAELVAEAVLQLVETGAAEMALGQNGG